jgi:hypothetical protein
VTGNEKMQKLMLLQDYIGWIYSPQILISRKKWQAVKQAQDSSGCIHKTTNRKNMK